MAEHAATVDGITFALLSTVAGAAEKAGVRWMVTGASARVLLLESVYGLPQGRATEDLDFVVMVEGWDHYEQLLATICSQREFRRDTKQAQRIRYQGDFYIDLVPFGGVESGSSTIAWPRRAISSCPSPVCARHSTTRSLSRSITLWSRRG